MRAVEKPASASRPGASIPAHTAWRLAAYSSGPTCGTLRCSTPLSLTLPPEGGGDTVFLVRGKLSHRLRDLLRVGHEEILLRGVERHGRDVGGGDAHHRPVEAVESMLRDDRPRLRSKTPADVVLVHDHRLAGLAR